MGPEFRLVSGGYTLFGYWIGEMSKCREGVRGVYDRVGVCTSKATTRNFFADEDWERSFECI
jgi:hypothetical protein